MKLPQFTKLRKEDLGADIPGWFDRVIYTFNKLADAVYDGMNSGLTVGENMKGQVLSLKIGTGDLPYKTSVKYAITDMWISAIREISGSRVDFTSPVWVDWVYDASNSNVIVYNISGLTAGKQYAIRMIALAEPTQ